MSSSELSPQVSMYLCHEQFLAEVNTERYIGIPDIHVYYISRHVWKTSMYTISMTTVMISSTVHSWFSDTIGLHKKLSVNILFLCML